MQTLIQPSAQPTPATSPGILRWEGHMSDGVGTTYGGEPLAFLEAGPKEIHLSGTRGTFRVPRTAIQKIVRGGFYPWFFGGIRIRHNVPGFPEFLLFKSMTASSREILGQLQGLGYPTG